MKIVCISDTHNQHNSIAIPVCDILIHAGDFSYKGDFFEVRDFAQWFVAQNARYRVMIVGNHELSFDPLQKQYNPATRALIAENKDIIYLENSSVTIEGIKLYGSPCTPRFFDWGFNVDRGLAIRKIWEGIDEDVNILITHGPPHGILDISTRNLKNGRDPHVGCADLLEIVERIKPEIHCFGHIHCSSNIQSNGITTFINASILDDDYKKVFEPKVIYYENGHVSCS